MTSIKDAYRVPEDVPVDDSLWHMSSQLARAQLARQISSQSSLRWQQQSRVHKPKSTGNSPQHISRRRNIAQQHRCTTHYEAQCYLSRRRTMTTATNNSSVQSRPATWHTPRSYVTTSYVQGYIPTSQVSENMIAQQHFIAARKESNSDGARKPSGKRQRYHSIPSDHSFINEYLHMPVSSDWATESSSQSSQYPVPEGLALPDIYQVGSYAAHDYDRPQQEEPSSAMSLDRDQPYGSAMLTTVRSCVNGIVPPTQGHVKQKEAFDDGPVLIAMGLYDPPEVPDPFSGTWKLSLGRGLKLEDAWIPPMDDDSRSDDDHEEDHDDEDQESEQREDDLNAASTAMIYPDVYGADNLLPLDMNKKPFVFEDGTSALQSLSMAEWNGGCLWTS